MADQQSHEGAPTRTKAHQKRTYHEWYDPDLLYKFWAMAGGRVAEAMRLAGYAAEDRVPPRRQTWEEYALRYKFAERFKKEQEEDWARFHAEVQASFQHVVDQITHALEMLGSITAQTILKRIAQLHSTNSRIAGEAALALSQFCGSIDALNRILRMLYRSQNLPEHIGQQNVQPDDNAVTCDELDAQDTFAPSIEEVRRRKKARAEESPEQP